MEIVLIITAVVFNIALSLGVGSSTLAIINFFVAIADGSINSDERKMMGIVYIVLRVAMVLLLLSSLVTVSLNVQRDGIVVYNPQVISTFILLFVLYLNAILMSLRIMPTSFGPSIQAGTWYVFGIVTTFTFLGILYSVTQFITLYILTLIFLTLVVNVIMMYVEHLSNIKEPKHKTPTKLKKRNKFKVVL